MNSEARQRAERILDDYLPGDEHDIIWTLANDVEVLSDRVDAAEKEREAFLGALWKCYVLSGEDTDGDFRFHMPDANVRQCAVAAVEGLRQDYDEACDGAALRDVSINHSAQVADE